jgi:HSP20 family molecular chaperone IbpA
VKYPLDFNHIWNDLFSDLLPKGFRDSLGDEINISETKTYIVISLIINGFKDEHLTVTADHEHIVISCEATTQSKLGYSKQSYSRILPMPQGIITPIQFKKSFQNNKLVLSFKRTK